MVINYCIKFIKHLNQTNLLYNHKINKIKGDFYIFECLLQLNKFEKNILFIPYIYIFYDIFIRFLFKNK